MVGRQDVRMKIGYIQTALQVRPVQVDHVAAAITVAAQTTVLGIQDILEKHAMEQTPAMWIKGI